MNDYSSLMQDGKHSDAFMLVALEVTKAIEESMKSDQVICLMCDDPDSLGAALVCCFLIKQTRSSEKQKKQYSA